MSIRQVDSQYRGHLEPVTGETPVQPQQGWALVKQL